MERRYFFAPQEGGAKEEEMMNQKEYNQKFAAYQTQMQNNPNLLEKILNDGAVADTQGNSELAGACYNIATVLFPKSALANWKRDENIRKWQDL
jgi:hypothetical protein